MNLKKYFIILSILGVVSLLGIRWVSPQKNYPLNENQSNLNPISRPIQESNIARIKNENQTEENRSLASVAMSQEETGQIIVNSDSMTSYSTYPNNSRQMFSQYQKRFKTFSVIKSAEMNESETGAKLRVFYAKTNYVDPMIEIVQEMAGDQIRNQSAMVSGQVIVMLKVDKTSSDLEEYLRKTGGVVDRMVADPAVYLVKYSAKDSSSVLEMVNRLKANQELIRAAEPDYLAFSN
jgi:hypothetical protein